MANLNGFNAATVEPSQDFDPIPAGKYLAVITDSEMKPTKSGTGQYLQLSLQILEGPYKGRYVWARLNLHNPNPTTVKIARQELSAICRGCGVDAANRIASSCTTSADHHGQAEEARGHRRR